MELKRKIVVFDENEQVQIRWYEILADDGQLIYVREQIKNDYQWETYINSKAVGIMKEEPLSGIPPRLGHSDNWYDNSLNKEKEPCS
jgi:hypothetical protein